VSRKIPSTRRFSLCTVSVLSPTSLSRDAAPVSAVHLFATTLSHLLLNNRAVCPVRCLLLLGTRYPFGAAGVYVTKSLVDLLHVSATHGSPGVCAANVAKEHPGFWKHMNDSALFNKLFALIMLAVDTKYVLPCIVWVCRVSVCPCVSVPVSVCACVRVRVRVHVRVRVRVHVSCVSVYACACGGWPVVCVAWFCWGM
jgi:hypothetical protein